MNRARRRQAARLWAASAALEQSYRATLRRKFAEVAARYVALVRRQRAPQKLDEVDPLELDDDVNGVPHEQLDLEELDAQVQEESRAWAFLLWLVVARRAVESRRAAQLAALGASAKMPEPGVAAAVAALGETMGKVVAKALKDFTRQVRKVLDDPENAGADVKKLVKLVEKRGEVLESKAEQIATQQVLVLNSEIVHARQTASGAGSYYWTTMGDDRVRDKHAALDGTLQSWDVPTDAGFPGDEPNCRCCAVPAQ